MRVLFISRGCHIRGQGTNQSITQQNSQERTHQGGRDFLADSSGGPPKAPMVMTTPKTAATMPSPGNESAVVLKADIGLLVC
jgi:hypothetical protein